jgi:hypothetical protein
MGSVDITAGAGTHIATNPITRDAQTEHMQLVNVADGSSGATASVDAKNRLATGWADSVTTGISVPPSAFNATVQTFANVAGYNVGYIQMTTAAAGGFLRVEGSYDGSTWTKIPTGALGSSPVSAGTSEQTPSVGIFNVSSSAAHRFYIGGFQQIRFAVESATSGTGAMVLVLSQSQSNLVVKAALMDATGIQLAFTGSNMPVAVQSALPAGANTIGSIEALKATYFASYTGLAATFVGDLVVLTGSASKIVRLRRVIVSGTASTGATVDMQLIKRTTADTGGTAVAGPALGTMDSNDAAATATIAAYSAVPTMAGAAGIIRVWKEQFLAAATYNDVFEIALDGKSGDKSPVLRGVAQQVALNIGAALVGGSVNVTFVWTEE